MSSPSFLAASLAVTAGGGIGSWLRFLVGRLYVAGLGPVRASVFPWGTLTVNIVGSLAMGLLVGWLARYGNASETARLFLAVGVLGGFTTFSSFSMEFALLVQRGTLGLAALYVGASLVAGFSALFLGLMLMRSAT